MPVLDQIGRFFLPLIACIITQISSASQASNPNNTDPSYFKRTAIIFDLGDVAIKTNSLAALYQTGMKHFVLFAACRPIHLLHMKPYIEERLFEVLSKIKPWNNKQTPAYALKGRRLPQIMCDWMTGTPCEQIRDTVNTELDQHPEYCNHSPFETNLIRAMATMMFTPEIFVKTRSLVKETHALALEYKKLGYELYILSNWDHASFQAACVQKEFSDFFDLMNGIIISGESGILKPDSAAYENLIKTYDLDPAACYFIDDQPENIAAAQHSGINSILCTSTNSYPNITKVRSELFESIYKNEYQTSNMAIV